MITENLQKMADAFQLNGYDIRIVGGAVRDMLLNKIPNDIDLCTNATPQEMIDLATNFGFKYVPTGLQHGTITIIVNNEEFEVTTLRVDTETDGRHAQVEFTRDFKLDAERRDLTINAMSMDFSGYIYDYFNGQEDLKNNIVRFVGDADKRVKEDYLRILRFFRFMAMFGTSNCSHEEIDTITSIENLAGLRRISVERYWIEINKLIKSPYADEVLRLMYIYGVLETIGLDLCTHSVKNLSSIGALSLMVPDVDQFLSAWKLSSSEQKQLRYLLSDKTDYNYKNELIDGIPRRWVMDYCMIMYENHDMINDIENWNIPVFDITGQYLLDRGMKPGREIGITLASMKDEWKKTYI